MIGKARLCAICIVMVCLIVCVSAVSAEQGDPIDAQGETDTPNLDDASSGTDDNDDAEPGGKKKPSRDAEPVEPTPNEPDQANEPEDVPKEPEPEQEPSAQNEPDDERPTDDQPNEPSFSQAQIPIRKINVTVDVDGCLFPGQVVRAHAKISPADATEQNLEWSSSEPRLVTIDQDGTVRVKQSVPVPRDGQYVDIWARATDGSFCMNCETVLVMPEVKRLRFLTGNVTVLTSAPTRRLGLPVEITPDALSGHVSIQWDSSDPDLVAVKPGGTSGEIGFITWGDAPGKATITATARDTGKSDRIIVTVEQTVKTIQMDIPSIVPRGSEIALSARCFDAAGSELPVSVAWALTRETPGVTLEREGRLRVDRFCEPSSVVVMCRALDAGSASARQTVRIVADTQQYERFIERK